jgi:hypothetical protein
MTPEPEKRIHGRTNHRCETVRELVVAPAGAGKFTARLDRRELCVSTKQIAPVRAHARTLQSSVADQSLGWSGGARG